MAFPAHPNPRSQRKPGPAGPSGTQASWLSSSDRPRRPTDTPCTRFSLASTVLLGTDAPPRRPTVDFTQLPAATQATPKLKRKTSKLPWSPFRSKALDVGAPSESPSSLLSAVEEPPKSKARSYTWQSNRSTSESDSKKYRINPPIPTRANAGYPHALVPRKWLESNPIQRSESAQNSPRSGRSLDISRLPQPPKPPRPPIEQSLATLDPDKQDGTFDRINPEGWNRVVPKQWAEGTFSDNESEADEERSIYSQDNGEEEAKRDLTLKLKSAVNNTAFLAGEATPFDPWTTQEHVSPSETEKEHISRQPRAFPVRQSSMRPRPRWPFEGPRSSDSTTSPVRTWLSSVRPPSEALPVVLNDGPETVVDEWPSHQACLTGFPYPPSDTEVPKTVHHDHHSEPEPTRKVKSRGKSKDRRLLPRPLRLQQVKTTSAIAAQIRAESTFPSDDLASFTNLVPPQQPLQASVNSSWTTILCPTEETEVATNSNSTSTANATHISNARRESDKNKPLPLVPEELAVSQYGSDEAIIGDSNVNFTERTEQVVASTRPRTAEEASRDGDLTDTIDEILALYHHDDSDSKQQPSSPVQPQPPRTPKPPPRPSRSSPSTPTSSSPNPIPPAPNPSSPTLAPEGSRFLSSHYIFYDARSYPELGHGKFDVERERRIHREGEVVVTCVDGEGGRWI